MLRSRSIRFRLTLWYAVVLTGALALFGALTWISLRHRLAAELDRELGERVEHFQNYFKAELFEGAAEGELRDELNEFCQALPASSYIAIRGESGFVFRYPPEKPQPEPESRVMAARFSASGETFEIVAGASPADIQHTLNLVGVLLWSLLPVVIAIACAGGWWLSGRALKPVQELTSAAHTISVENLSRRLPVLATGDELARLSAVLNGMLERLEGAVKTLSQFAADASHELRTPLAVIRTTADLALRRERTAEAYRESIQEIAMESERMTALIEDLLTLARHDTGAAEMPFEPVDLGDLIREASAKVRGLADLREVRIVESIEERVGIAGHRAALYRLFLVLADNAIKYSRHGGEVRLAARVDGAQIVASIEDHGEGISSADLPHIFKRFYRADRSRSSAGHGIGLALADSIARAHGARIEVESKEGAGSTFRVIFAARAISISDNLQVARVD